MGPKFFLEGLLITAIEGKYEALQSLSHTSDQINFRAETPWTQQAPWVNIFTTSI